MKWMIASDIHGSAHYGALLADRFAREGADRLVLLGDLLYHGPRNDLPHGYDPKRLIGILNGLRERILCVRGNCDSEVDQMVLGFPIMADCAELCMGGGIPLVHATHGHLSSEESPPPLPRGSILLCGHTHVPACRDHGTFMYLNPGSVSLPKEGSRHGYIVAEGGTFTWKDVSDGAAWQEWDAAAWH